MGHLQGPAPRSDHALGSGPSLDSEGGGGRPFLRWAGSKRKLIDRLASYWSEKHTRYVEPFAGSACLFFHLAPGRAILGDINRELIATYQQIRDNTSAVVSSLTGFRKGRTHYLRVRAMGLSMLSASERAARFIYLNRYCFNGLYRTNRQGVFNVPYGGQKSGRLPPREAFEQCAHLLRRADLVPGDFEAVLARVGPTDFVYLDPPFSVRSRRVFCEYGPSTFGHEDISRLRECLRRIDRRGATFLVSYADSAEARHLADGYNVRAVAVQRHIAGFARNRVRARELLISNRVPAS